MNRIDVASADALIVAATADGATDVSTAIQTALDAIPSTGGKVWFPPNGTYVAANLTPKAKTTLIVPPGATLKLKDSAGNVPLISSSSGRDHIRITGGGILDGNKANNETNTSGVVQIAGDYTDVSGMVIQNGSYGVRSSGGDYASIVGNVIAGHSQMGIIVGKDGAVSNYWLIAHNTVTHGGAYAAIRGDGLTGSRPQSSRIIGNDVEMTATGAGNIGIEIWGFCERFVVSQNTIRGGYTGISFDNSPSGVIQGNSIYNISSCGIELATASINCAVIGNTIDVNGNLGAIGIGCSNTGNAKSVISENSIYRFSGKGIHILSGADYALSGNSFFDGADCCIYLQNSNRVSVRGGVASGITGNKQFVVSDQTSDFSVMGANVYALTTFVLLYAPSSALDNVLISNNQLLTVTNAISSSVFGGGSLGSNIVMVKTGLIDYLDYAANITERWGTGSPESVVSAGVGSIFHRTDGGAGTCLYIKESGTGNTGWIGK